MVDWDELLTYKTFRVVKIRDYRLGLIHYGIIFIVFAYIGVYIMWLKRGYYASSSYVGSTALKIKGMSYSLSSNGSIVPWSSEDLVQPSIEKDALFITTSIITTASQTRGLCAAPFYNCTRDSDCQTPRTPAPLFTGECVQGACALWQWCPAENITDAGVASPPSYESDVLTADSLTIWMKATMAFPSLRPGKTYSTVNQNDPVSNPNDPQRNIYSLKDLLTLTDTKYSDIIDRGCILLVKLNWECYLDGDGACFPSVTAARLDNRSVNTGFNFRMPQYYREDDVLTRDLIKYTGVRIFFSSEGVGYLTSIPQIVLQASSGLAMLTIATLATDFILEYLMPQRKRYAKYKFMETEDFTQHVPIPTNYGSTDPSLPILAKREDDIRHVNPMNM